jgi:hypothetical protein
MLPGGRGISPKKDCLVFHWHSYGHFPELREMPQKSETLEEIVKGCRLTGMSGAGQREFQFTSRIKISRRAME